MNMAHLYIMNYDYLPIKKGEFRQLHQITRGHMLWGLVKSYDTNNLGIIWEDEHPLPSYFAVHWAGFDS